MPTTVQASNGNTYHLWQLPDLSSPEPEVSISFTTLDLDLSDGYRSTRLFGSNTGVRKWRLNMPTLAGSDIGMPTVTDINGASVSREEYIWSLYTENKVTGTPFAYTDPRSGQYYLVDFEEDELSYQRMRVKLYSTGLTLRQRRLSGVTIFNPLAIKSNASFTPYLWLKGEDYIDGAETWTNSTSSGYVQGGSGDVDLVAAVQNGHDIVRYNNTTNNGYTGSTASPLSFQEVFIVMKMREATFSNNAGILTDSGAAGTQVLTGSSGTSKFTNPSLPADEFLYELNGTEYAQSDLQAPMNAWGLVHVRYTSGYSLTTGSKFGQNRTAAGTFAEQDIGEIVLFTSVISKNQARALSEHLIIKWGLS